MKKYPKETFIQKIIKYMVGLIVCLILIIVFNAILITPTVTVDNENFCKAIATTGNVAYKLHLTGDVDILLPTDNEDQAQIYAAMRYGILLNQNSKESYTKVLVAGCKHER